MKNSVEKPEFWFYRFLFESLNLNVDCDETVSAQKDRLSVFASFDASFASLVVGGLQLVFQKVFSSQNYFSLIN